jgi:concanavalin A-like lectin/glucanase superfamily protein/putative pyrroloquinoline-quinone binding quinoprotein
MMTKYWRAMAGVLALGLGVVLAVPAEAQINFVDKTSARTGSPAPTYQAAGAAQAGTGALTVPWPTHQADDIGLLIIENDNNAVTLGANAANWTQVTNSPQGTGPTGQTGAAATRLTVFWSRATSGMLSVGVNAVSNHQRAQILTFRGVITSGDPWNWNATAGDVAATAGTAVSIPGATTTVNQTLVVAIVANGADTNTLQTSSWANADLLSLTERANGNTNAGNGGGFGVATGVKEAAGPYAATTAGLSISSVQARMSIALRPPLPATTLTINKPPLTGSGHVMIASIAFRASCCGVTPADVGITPPAGWTPVRRIDNPAGQLSSLAVYWKVAGAEPGPYQWSFSCTGPTCGTFNEAAGGILSFSGVDTTTPIDQEDWANTSSATWPSLKTPSLNVTVAGTMLVTSHAIANYATWASPPPSGMTEAFQERSGGTAIQVSYAPWADQVPTGTREATDTGPELPDNGNAHILALRKSCQPVSAPTYAAANAQNGNITVYWTSADPVVILRMSSVFTTEAPANLQAYTQGTTPGGSVGTAYVAYVGSAGSSLQTGLSTTTNYSYKVFANSGNCYSSGVAVNLTPNAGTRPAWSYMLAGGSTLKPGIAGGDGTITAPSNAGYMVSLDTATGAPKWKAATTSAVQGWLNWLPTNSALGYWKLDDGSGTTAADSSGKNPGTLINGPTWTTGKIGQALSFNRTSLQYVSVPHNAAFNPFPITVAAWFKTPGYSQPMGIVTKRAAGAGLQGWDLYVGGTTGKLTADYYAGSLTERTLFTSTLSVNDDSWHHGVMVVDASGTLTLYADGAALGSAPWGDASPVVTTSTNDLRIGSQPSSAEPYFLGLIDEVRVYNRALSATDVAELYAATTPSTATVFGADQGGKIYAVDTLGAGVKSWEVTLTGAEAFQAPTSAQLRAYSNAAFQSAPAFATTTDVILAASYNTTITPCGTPSTNNRLFAIRPSDGAVLWTFNGTCTSLVDYISGMPAVDYVNNRIFLTSHAGSGTQTSYFVINSLNGALIGSLGNLGHIDSSPAPSYNGTTVYVGTTAGKLYAINNAAPPTLKWGAPFDLLSASAAVKGFIWEDFAAPGKLYLATSDGFVWCVQDQGASAVGCAGWPNPARVAVPGPSTPLEMGGYLYVGSNDGNLYEINLATGAPKTLVVGAGTAAVGDVSTDDGGGIYVFVGTSAGRIYKIQIPLP